MNNKKMTGGGGATKIKKIRHMKNDGVRYFIIDFF